LEWKENGSLMQEVIGRSFPEITLAIGQTLRVSFDYRQIGVPNNSHLVRAGFYNFSNPIAAHNWAGSNAIGSWKGYGTFVRDDSTSTATNVARVESGTTASANAGPNNGTSGTYTDIGTKVTPYNLNDDGTVTYQLVFDVTQISPTRMDTLLTVSSTNGTPTTHFSIPGSQTSGTLHTTFDTLVLKQAGGTAMPAYYDNIKVELIGGINPAFFSDWQEISWPGNSDPAVISPHADPDSDGTSNFLEWALRLDPNKPDHFQPVVLRDGDYLLFTYQRRKTAPGEANFQVEWSDTLGNDWSTHEVVTAPANPIDGTAESITASLPLGNNSKRFIRVKVSSP
jgi:hypothetical protein